ncbi:MAG: ABC transporter substrate-binding protein [Verrucomicrobia bacterium]|jgi:NitT/TauT family transport system substrate-binding protein|nr:ABC transporter substrate-binding protein [Verrucomicrobiota bacterium]
METIKIALDWTPNTIHSGLLLALHEDRYREANLGVELISPEIDNYTRTPARRLAAGEVDFAIAPSESVIAYQTSRNHQPLVAVASILQRDTSAIVTLASSGIERPAQLDGKVYASYDARFEDAIVRAMVRNDGGEGTFKPVIIERLGIWDMLKKGEADATWVFMPWEGVQAERRGIKLNVFQMEDFGIPYGYTPLILAHEKSLQSRKPTYRKFINITAEAYQAAIGNPGETAHFFASSTQLNDFKDTAFIEASLNSLKSAQLNERGQWGQMEKDVWQAFIDWLIAQELLGSSVRDRIDQLFTNTLLPA